VGYLINRARIVALVFALTLVGFPTLAGVTSGASGIKHAPIAINSDGDFAACACVVSGSGTTVDPYTIGPLTINNTNGVAVSVDGTTLTKSFRLLNLTIAGNRTTTDTGIVLNHINLPRSPVIAASVVGQQTSIQTNNVGILVENSNGVTLDGAGGNPNGPGIGAHGAGTVNQNLSGAIDIENSSNITVRGWQMSANGVDGQPDWLGFDPSLANWGVGGVRFFDVSNSTIDHNAFNNDTSMSMSLFDSSHNVVSNNTADYPYTMNFLLTDGSTYNTVTGNVAGTADFIDILVADPLPVSQYGPTHDNVISNNQLHADGPTGAERSAGVAPAFLGGIVVLNGTYNNQILGNSISGDPGAGLSWAQAVPSSPGSAINVVAYPPLLDCNVTASEGGGGVANLNGNVWTGNTTNKSFAPCIPAQ
jgi:parallel beta-helix repeat protein